MGRKVKIGNCSIYVEIWIDLCTILCISNFVEIGSSSVILIDFDKIVVFVVIFEFTENVIFDATIDIFVVLNVILVDLNAYFVDFVDFFVILNG